MAKKKSSLKNRLGRHVADRRSGVVATAFQPTHEDRSLFEVCWTVLSRARPLVVAGVDELAERLGDRPPFSSAQATGWIAGALGAGLAYPSSVDPLANPKLQALEEDVIEALGPDAVWYANGDHPLPAFRPRGSGRGWASIIDATFDVVIAARGNGLDLVLGRVDED